MSARDTNPAYGSRSVKRSRRTRAEIEALREAILCLADKARPGFLVCVHSDDLETLTVEFCAAHASDELMARIRRAYDRLHGFDEQADGPGGSP